jgi:phosphoribosylamine--glycine ligase
VLSATATGSDLAEARERAYALVDAVQLRGSQHRTDIAARAAAGAVNLPVHRGANG